MNHSVWCRMMKIQENTEWNWKQFIRSLKFYEALEMWKILPVFTHWRWLKLFWNTRSGTQKWGDTHLAAHSAHSWSTCSSQAWSWASGVIRAWFALCLCGTPAGLASVRPPISNVSPKLQSVRDGFVVSSEISSLLREKYVFMWVVYLKQHMIHWYWCVCSIYYWR